METRAYEEALGVTSEEASRRFELRNEAGWLNATLESEEGDTFGGMYLVHTPAFQIVVLFTENADDTLARYVEGSVLKGVAVARTSLVTQRDIEDVANSIDLTGVGAASVTGFIKQGEIVIEVETPADAEIAAQAVASVVPDRPVPVRIEIGPGTPTPDVDIYGGLALSGCTAGFSVIGTRQGILTAGHCNDSQTYQGVNLPFQMGLNEGRTDAQWHTTPGFVDRPWVQDPYFDSTTPYYLVVTSVTPRSQQMIDDFVCKYGKTSQWTCGYIISKIYRPLCLDCPVDATASYIRVYDDGVDISDAGDSGGPWVHGGAAFGVHSGGVGTGVPDIHDGYYTAINYVEDDLNVGVKIVAP